MHRQFLSFFALGLLWHMTVSCLPERLADHATDVRMAYSELIGLPATASAAHTTDSVTPIPTPRDTVAQKKPVHRPVAVPKKQSQAATPWYTSLGKKLRTGNTYLQSFSSVNGTRGFAYRIIGKYFMRLWQKSWQVIMPLFERAVGRSKFYVTDTQGNLLRDKKGKLIPRVYELDETGKPKVDFDGQPVKNFWWEIKGQSNLALQTVGHVAVEQAVQRTLSHIEKHIFRPTVSIALGMPAWKTSYTQYLREMYEITMKTQNVTEPNRHPLSAARLVPSIRASMTQHPEILAQLDISFKDDAPKSIQKAIAEKLSEPFQPIYKTLLKRDATAHSPREAQLELLKHRAQDLARPAAEIAASPVVLPGKALHAIGTKRFGLGKKEPLSYDTVTALLTACAQIRAKQTGKTSDAITITLQGSERTLNVSDERRLLWAEDKAITLFAPLIKPAIMKNVDSYDVYLRKLIAPRLLEKMLPFVPQKVRMRILGSDQSLENISQHLESTEKLRKRFLKAYNATIILTDLMAAVIEVRHAPKLAGNYVKLFDSIDLFLRFWQEVMGAADIKELSLAKRVGFRMAPHLMVIPGSSSFGGMRGSRTIKYLYSFDQWEKIERAAQKARTDASYSAHRFMLQKLITKSPLQDYFEFVHNKPTETIKVTRETKRIAQQSADELLSILSRVKKTKDTATATFFYGESTQTTATAAPSEENKQIQHVKKVLGGFTHFAKVFSKFYQKWGLKEVIIGIDEMAATTETPFRQMNYNVIWQITAERMGPHLIGMGAQILFDKLFDSIVKRLPLPPAYRAALLSNFIPQLREQALVSTYVKQIARAFIISKVGSSRPRTTGSMNFDMLGSQLQQLPQEQRLMLVLQMIQQLNHQHGSKIAIAAAPELLAATGLPPEMVAPFVEQLSGAFEAPAVPASPKADHAVAA